MQSAVHLYKLRLTLTRYFELRTLLLHSSLVYSSRLFIGKETTGAQKTNKSHLKGFDTMVYIETYR